MADEIMTKDKRYNMCCKLVEEKENEREQLLKEIEELKLDLISRKNECKKFL
ncbi:MAG: hypothetical protein MJ252_20025 [archaeon]|nr:hypothetical protein [archaeon]